MPFPIKSLPIKGIPIKDIGTGRDRSGQVVKADYPMQGGIGSDHGHGDKPVRRQTFQDFPPASRGHDEEPKRGTQHPANITLSRSGWSTDKWSFPSNQFSRTSGKHQTALQSPFSLVFASFRVHGMQPCNTNGQDSREPQPEAVVRGEVAFSDGWRKAPTPDGPKPQLYRRLTLGDSSPFVR